MNLANGSGIQISVIVPVYNEQRFLDTCIDRLVSQQFPENAFEIIMVDNNSTDVSTQIISNCNRIRLLREEKHGSYAARNRGIVEAKGNILAFTDADCRPDLDWLSRIANAMQCPETHVLMGACRFRHETPMLSLLADYESEKARYVCSQDDKAIYFGYTNNMAVRRQLFDRTGPFLEIERGADVVFVRRVLDIFSCDSIRFDPKLRVQHMEIGDLRDYYRKRRIYGRSFAGYRSLSPVRPLNTVERLRVFREVKYKSGCSFAKGILLLLTLILGALFYELGRREA